MVNRNGLMKRRWEQASYTVEAAFVVPLGFLVLMSLSWSVYRCGKAE